MNAGATAGHIGYKYDSMNETITNYNKISITLALKKALLKSIIILRSTILQTDTYVKNQSTFSNFPFVTVKQSQFLTQLFGLTSLTHFNQSPHASKVDFLHNIDIF